MFILTEDEPWVIHINEYQRLWLALDMERANGSSFGSIPQGDDDFILEYIQIVQSEIGRKTAPPLYGEIWQTQIKSGEGDPSGSSTLFSRSRSIEPFPVQIPEIENPRSGI
jgi:hypothetical protein